MTGKLYVIGVGPGDPELLTLKAIRIIKDISCICVPKGREEGSSLALSIVKKALNLEGKEIIEAHFPMRKMRTNTPISQYPNAPDRELNTKWQGTIEVIYDRLSKGTDTAFLTIGDPTIYSTFFYLYDRLLELDPGLDIEIIPGVSSINAAAASANLCLALADERIAILPATYTDDIREALRRSETVVLMKVHRVFDRILAILDEMDLTNNAVYVLRAGMEDERVFEDIRDVRDEDLDYFSVVIIKR